MKKNRRDMIEEKTLKTWGDRVGGGFNFGGGQPFTFTFKGGFPGGGGFGGGFPGGSEFHF